MSNTEANPVELLAECGSCPLDGSGHPVVEVLSAREVPLGGPRAMTVRRTLPQKQRSMIGAWCFADHYGRRVAVLPVLIRQAACPAGV